MADPQDLEHIEELPEPVREFAAARARGEARDTHLHSILRGQEWEGVVESLMTTGTATYRDKNGKEHMVAADFDAEGHLIAMAAAIPRNPGKSFDFIKEIADFKDALTADKQGRKDAIAMFHNIVKADGLTANAINKMAALVAADGRFKVKSVKGKRGQGPNKVADEFEFALNWWKDNFNADDLDGVITGDKGATAFIRQGARLSLIEGDHIARHVWPTKTVMVPYINKPLSLPMNLQSFSAQNVDVPQGLEGTNYEILYWTPPQQFISLLQNPKDPNLKKILQKTIPAKVRTALIKDKQYFLDPALMIHIKHRPTGVDTFGSSLIEPTLSDLRYKRALDALEITVITNLIARAVIIKIGSDNEKSVYHQAEVTSARLGLLQRMMRNVGPSPTILWPGPDIEVVEVSAHDALPDLVERYKIAERRQVMALGIPVVILIGESGDGTAVAVAASIALAAQLKELQDQYAQAFTSLAVRIAEANGYEAVDVAWEWEGNLLEDKEAAANLLLKAFQVGLLDTQTTIEELGYEYGPIESRMQYDVQQGYREKPFGPPLGAVTTNPVGSGGDTGGRPTQKQNPSKDPRAGKPTNAPVANR